MGRGKRRIPLTAGPSERRLPAVLVQSLELSPAERWEIARRSALQSLEPYFGSEYGVGQALDYDEVLIHHWRTGFVLPDDEELARIQLFLAVAQQVDELSGSRLATGDWMRTPHYDLPSPAADPLSDSPSLDWTFPGHCLAHFQEPALVLAAAGDDFQDDSRRHRAALAAKGYALDADGTTRAPGAARGNDGLSPYFHRRPRDLGRPTLGQRR